MDTTTSQDLSVVSERVDPTTSGIELHYATEADFQQWFELLHEVASEGVWMGTEAPVDEERARGLFDSATRDGRGFMLLAWSGDVLAGALGAHPAEGRLHLGMFVRAAYRGRGVGSALLQTCVTRARQLGAYKLTLDVFLHNQLARRLYRRFGFVEEGTLRRHYRRQNGELWDAVVMGFVLDEESPGFGAGAAVAREGDGRP